MNAPFPTRPRISLSIPSRSAVKESGVASSGKWLLYLCMNFRARNRPFTSSGAKQSYLWSLVSEPRRSRGQAIVGTWLQNARDHLLVVFAPWDVCQRLCELNRRGVFLRVCGHVEEWGVGSGEWWVVRMLEVLKEAVWIKTTDPTRGLTFSLLLSGSLARRLGTCLHMGHAVIFRTLADGRRRPFVSDSANPPPPTHLLTQQHPNP